MTIVIGRRFDKRIVLLSDSMISRGAEGRDSLFPGQLKMLVLSLDISMAYAGHLVTGLDAARRCKMRLRDGGDVNDVLDALARSSADGSCDFLVASHVHGPELIKVSGGRVSAPQPSHWIGNPEILKEIDRAAAEHEEGLLNVMRQNPELTPARSEEGDFTGAFFSLLLGSPQVSNDVGGIAMRLLASPFGHCYQQHAGIYLVGPSNFSGAPHPDAPAPGGNAYGYNFLESGYRGVAIAGAYMTQARLGFIYDPLRDDQPKTLPDTTMAEVLEELKALAVAAGGKPDREC